MTRRKTENDYFGSLNTMPIKVALCEDNDAFRESLQQYINDTAGFSVTTTCGNAEDIIAKLQVDLPDIVLMDIDMPGIDGITATALVKSHFPTVNVLILTVYDDDEKIFNAILSGATGYILKKTPPNKIIEAITEIYHGGASMSASIVKRVLSFFQHNTSTSEEYALSARELSILKCLVNGDSYKMIANNCEISIGTVRTHITSIYKKLHINSKSEAVAKAIKEKLV
ncbi:MAG: response regulator [Candidatus Dadabacteria bacterium]